MPGVGFESSLCVTPMYILESVQSILVLLRFFQVSIS